MLELNKIYWGFPDGEEIIKGICLKIFPGKLTVITESNDSGKTSIAKLIAGLVSPDQGQIFLDRTDITILYILRVCLSGTCWKQLPKNP